jgi:hypothetical protein
LTHLFVCKKTWDNAQRGLEVLKHCSDASWWEWTRGSALDFWRWSIHQELALNGCVPFLLDNLPKFKRPSQIPLADKRLLIAEKLHTIIARGYLTSGPVQSLIQFFDVPKADDICLVCNRRSCGLNKVTWAPNIWLPTSQSALRVLDYNYYSVDLDWGKCS